METKVKEGLESLSVIGWGRWVWHSHIHTYVHTCIASPECSHCSA